MMNPGDEKAGRRQRPPPSATQVTKREKAVEALMQQPTVERAAEAAGIHVATLYRWLKEPEFKFAMLDARQAKYLVGQGRVQSFGNTAINVLAMIMVDKQAPPTARVSACKTLLDLGAKGAEGVDSQMRMTKMEADYRKDPDPI